MTTRVQGSGVLTPHAGVTTVGPHVIGTGALGNLTAGNKVRLGFVHYSSTPAHVISAVTVNGVSAQLRKRQIATNAENQADIWECDVPAGGPPVVTVLYAGVGTPDGHYLSGAIQEVSGSGAVRGTPDGDTATNTTPGSTTDALTQVGDDALQVLCWADGGAPTMTGPTPGWTTEFNLNAGGFEYGAAVWRVIGTAGAQAWNWTTSISGNWATALVVWEPASAPVDPFPAWSRHSIVDLNPRVEPEALPSRRNSIAALIAVVAVASPLTERVTTQTELRVEESRPVRRRFVLPSGAVAADPVPFPRHALGFVERGEEPLPVRARRLPESVDDPAFLLWATFEERDEEPRARRAKPGVLSSGAAPAADLLLALERTLPIERGEEPLNRLRRRLPESVDQPLLGERRQVVDDRAIEPVRRLQGMPTLTAEVVVDAPPPARHQPIFDTLPEEARIRVLLRLPESGASVDQPPPPRERQPVDVAIEEPRIRLRQRLPESVDAPPVPRVRQSVDVEQEEPRPRRSLKLPDPTIAPPGDAPPAPRWRTTYDAPLEDLKSARGRFVLPTGPLVLPDQPAPRWRTSAERPVEEPRISRPLRLPESVDLPSFTRPRQVVDEPQNERRPVLEPSPAAWAVVLIADQPLALRRLLPEVQVVEWLPRQRRRLPESVDLPPLATRRAPRDEQQEEVRPEAARLVYVEPPPEAFIPSRWRSVFEPSVEERAVRRPRKLPDYVPPPPGDEIPPKPWSLVSFSHPYEIPPLPRRLSFLIESGPLPPPVASPRLELAIAVERMYVVEVTVG